MRFKRVIKFFKRGNVCVTGLRGTGKDLLFGNVIARRYEDYVSNLNYGGFYHLLDLEALDARNCYKEFISGNIREFIWQYPDGADVYISDVGIYFPSQYCNELNKQYGGIITYMALSRQVSLNNVHINAQNLNRCWDKIREQSDTYIRCRWSIYFFGLVLQGITIYDKYQSAVDRINPCRVHVPLLNAQAKATAQTYRDNFFNVHGTVKNKILIYRNKSEHNTLAFREMLGNEPYDRSFKKKVFRLYWKIRRKYRFLFRRSLLFKIVEKIKIRGFLCKIKNKIKALIRRG